MLELIAIYFFFLVAFSVFPLLCLLVLMKGFIVHRRRKGAQNCKIQVAFLHPRCTHGGGGEAVLWNGIAEMLNRFQDKIDIVIYAETLMSVKEILAKVEQDFGIVIPDNSLQIIQMRFASLEFYPFPFLTLILQSFGSLICAFESVFRFVPDIMIDSTGLAFTFPIFRLAGCVVTTYTHYPTISVDMLKVVKEQTSSFNNNQIIARSFILSKIKHFYYRTFAFLYSFCGSFSKLVIVNGTWTANHIQTLWKVTPTIVYPPCGIPLSGREKEQKKELVKSLCLNSDSRIQIISIAQFRPEKDHRTQVFAIQKLIESHPEMRKRLKFVMIGSTRGQADVELKNGIRNTIKELCLDDIIEVPDTTTYEEKNDHLSKSAIGIHTMKNEHFGISVVEFLSFGVVPIAHFSAGPRLDIVVPSVRITDQLNEEKNRLEEISNNCEMDFMPTNECGCLAETVDEYANALYYLLNSKHLSILSNNGFEQANKFSTETFRDRFCNELNKVIQFHFKKENKKNE